MMENHLRVERLPGPGLGVLIAGSHALAIAGLYASSAAFHYQLALGFAVVSSFLYSFNQYCLLNQPGSVLTVILVDEEWQLVLKSGECVTVDLTFPVFVSRSLVVMNFKDQGGRQFPVAIFDDGADSRQMRHLRVFLKLGMAQPKLGGTKMVSFGSSSSSG